MLVFGKAGMFSPRAWGWSGLPVALNSRCTVLPTRVGMVRSESIPLRNTKRSPHARGDGPAHAMWQAAVFVFSPRAWGWSGDADSAKHVGNVLPTRVGMVRRGST